MDKNGIVRAVQPKTHEKTEALCGGEPVTLGALYARMCAAFAAAGVKTPDLDARLMIERRLGFGWGDLIARPETLVEESALEALEPDIRARIGHMPVSRIYGEREFYGLPFRIDAHTLDPRPDSETLVDAALKAFESGAPETILDLGTGSGCLLIALLARWEGARGIGVDRQMGALEMARKNAARNGVEGRALFVLSDWHAALGAGFDVIVANPPYIPAGDIANLAPEVRNFDPIPALEGGEDGLQAYKKIFSGLGGLLKPRGRGFFEVGFGQAEDVGRLAEDSGFSVRGVHPDLAGIPRVVEISHGDK
ncbi:MAG: peptide chain release factor N(5)-glutamine methyltransferase [Alphaproteobacteria bacterium]|nr:peptide chain release factor N(5)-glutamine methyltransferase [Alphaproteobacteria bacterium]